MDDSLVLERRPAFGAWIFLTVTLGLLAAAIAFQQPQMLIGAILPLALTVCLWLIRPPETTLYFGPDSISDDDHQELIRYDEIVGLTVAGRTPAVRTGVSRSGRLIISGQNRNDEFPQLTKTAASRAYEMLIDRIPETGTRDVALQLKEALSNDLKQFEDDLVFSYRGRRGVLFSNRDANWIFLSLVIVGIVWSIVGTVQQNPWIGAGIATTLVALIIWPLSALSQRSYNAQVPNRESASLIISPRGIALSQGHLMGELKWNEVKALSCDCVTPGTMVVRHHARAISITVAGAQIVINDIYDRPLATIYRCMMRYWQVP